MDRLPETVGQVEALAITFLRLTREGPNRRRWHRDRMNCRELLRECRRPGYDRSADLAYDLDWLEDLFTALIHQGLI
jgi:hypothetical protein